MFIPSPAELALAVQSQRKNLKLSQAQVANLVGLKQKTISAFENKPEGTKIETLFLILSAVKLDLNLINKTKSSSSQSEWKEEW